MPKKIKPGDRLPAEVAELFEKHQRYLEAGRANYGRADKVLEEILELCEPGVEHLTEARGRKPPQSLTLVDQFADRNQVSRIARACSRVSLDVLEFAPAVDCQPGNDIEPGLAISHLLK